MRFVTLILKTVFGDSAATAVFLVAIGLLVLSVVTIGLSVGQ
jgi:hypothetical protein